MPAPSRLQTVSVERMQQIDAAAIHAVGIPRLVLMEHAGGAVAQAVKTLLPPRDGRVLVCCGMGFNGGDGLSAARHLQTWGYAVRLLLAGQVARLREEPAVYATILQRLDVEIAELTTLEQLARFGSWIASCGLIVDALLGIGARGDVREPMASLIRAMNQSGKPIVAADLPSGLDGDTGAVQGIAVEATLTVAFGLAKRGCVTGEGPRHAGSLAVDSITMPPHLLTP